MGTILQKYLYIFSWITGNSDMHCKNFSLIDRKDGLGYVLSPAYDLLAVLLTGIGGYDRDSFVSVMTECGVDLRYANTIIDSIIACKDKWFEIIDISFLDQKMKSRYMDLINERLGRL